MLWILRKSKNTQDELLSLRKCSEQVYHYYRYYNIQAATASHNDIDHTFTNSKHCLR